MDRDIPRDFARILVHDASIVSDLSSTVMPAADFVVEWSPRKLALGPYQRTLLQVQIPQGTYAYRKLAILSSGPYLDRRLLFCTPEFTTKAWIEL